jgi:glycosyltransferase involved in cell wall biosynthesis
VNITHVVESLGRGGLERMVLELVKAQQRSGHRCQVVCLFETGMLARELAEFDVPVRSCDKQHGLDMRALRKAHALIRAHASEVMHTHNTVAHYYAVLAGLGLGVRHVVNTRHGMDNGKGGRHGRREWLYRQALRRTDAVVSVCDAARRDLVQRGIVPPTKARVVPNGIRLEAYQPASADGRAWLRHHLALPPQTRLVGNVGRLNWAKDHANLIRAFRRVHASLPDTALVLVGDGNLRDELQQCVLAEGVDGAVHFLGDRDDVPALLQGLDLFVLSSRSEGYSVALLEACAAALPIVATDVGGNGEIVRNDLNGRLVPAGDPQVLADAIIAVLDDPRHAAAFGQAAQAWVRQHATLETMAAHYEAIYRGSRE